MFSPGYQITGYHSLTAWTLIFVFSGDVNSLFWAGSAINYPGSICIQLWHLQLASTVCAHHAQSSDSQFHQFNHDGCLVDLSQ
jgi:hypothetical protein